MSDVVTADRVGAVMRHLYRQFEIAALNDLRKRLQDGAQGSGLSLTARECSTLADHLSYPKQPRGNSVKDVANTKQAKIAEASFAYERAGKGRKSAIELTMQQFKCRKSTVYAARKVHKPSK
jgi:hypothetical protein